MGDTKFNAVTKGFQTSYRQITGGREGGSGGARQRKFYKKLANRRARRAWFDGRPVATEYCW